jgi:secreted PhoX family phosphatase
MTDQDRDSESRPSLNDLIEQSLSRREVILGLAAAGTVTAVGAAAPAAAQPQAQASFNFPELAGGVDEKHHVADGYDADILIRWGDPLFPDSPAFDPLKQTAAAQKRQFGMNNDFLGFIPLQADGNRGLLCVHHEYAESQMMFPGLSTNSLTAQMSTTADQVSVEMASMGGSIVEIARTTNKWSYNRASNYNRRITSLDTPMTIDGPAAGDARMKTSGDPTGTRVVGTINNCAGGITPWNTWLMTEENWHFYFGTAQLDDKGRPKKGLGGAQEKSWARFDVPGMRTNWSKYVDRFNVDKEPNEPNRFGWIVEVDPLDPASTPVKHTALGRFRHEGAENAIARDGRVVVYSGDDDTNEFAYKFVSNGRYDPANRAANMRLLSEGTLYVARYNADLSGEWLPLVHGQGGLTAANGFASQADVLIDTRLAATAVGATPMDRPEDFEPGPGGRVVLALTNNAARKAEAADAANPRGPNPHGHVIEMMEDGGDVGATKFKWSILVLCGDPAKPEHKAKWHPETTADGWFAAPDQVAFDPAGRLWIGTDQGTSWARLSGKADGLYAVEHSGDKRGLSKLFFRCPVGAEFCGPRFTADGTTLFVAVQHPSADGTADWKPFGKASKFEDPATRWPDFKADMPPRPAVVVITRKGGGKIA